MTRFILALAAIVLLAFSAGLTRTQLPQLPFAAHPGAHTASAPAASGPARMLLHGGSAPIVAPLATISGEEAPAPALLIYLVLILVGSAIAVGRVRHTQRREI